MDRNESKQKSSLNGGCVSWTTGRSYLVLFLKVGNCQLTHLASKQERIWAMSWVLNGNGKQEGGKRALPESWNRFSTNSRFFLSFHARSIISCGACAMKRPQMRKVAISDGCWCALEKELRLLKGHWFPPTFEKKGIYPMTSLSPV